MNYWNYILNLLIPSSSILITSWVFADSEHGRFYPYIVTLLGFSIHTAAVLAYSRVKKKGHKWTFFNFLLLMLALSINILIFEQFLFDK